MREHFLTETNILNKICEHFKKNVYTVLEDVNTFYLHNFF